MRDKPLYIAVFLNGVIAVSELVFGLLSNSLALISDATHNLTDFFSVFLALISRIVGRKPPTYKHTYGFRRLEIFAALFNGLILFGIMILIFKESISRLLSPISPPNQIFVIIVGTIAFVANSISVIVLSPHKKDDVNIKAAFLHLFQDAFISLIVIISALFYTFPFGKYADSVATILISVLVLKGVISILWETLITLLEGAPPNIDIKEICNFVEEKNKDLSIHHIHLWQNGPSEILLTAHIHFNENRTVQEIEEIFLDLKGELKEKWKITHSTFEPEFNGCGEKEVISNQKYK